MTRKITAKMIDWEAYKDHLKDSISNERIWGLGGSQFANQNIAEFELELEDIEDEDYDLILDKYDDEFFEDYLLEEYEDEYYNSLEN